MTNRDILIEILSEVCGQRKDVLAEGVNMLPSNSELDRELSENEAQSLLGKLRQEKSGILNWVIEGRRRALARHENANLN